LIVEGSVTSGGGDRDPVIRQWSEDALMDRPLSLIERVRDPTGSDAWRRLVDLCYLKKQDDDLEYLGDRRDFELLRLDAAFPADPSRSYKGSLSDRTRTAQVDAPPIPPRIGRVC
jgi:hypothetical protein